LSSAQFFAILPGEPGAMRMTRHMAFFLLMVTSVQVASPVAASAQSMQPIGTANAIGSVANTNTSAGASTSSNSASTFTSTARPPVLLPNGSRVTPSNSTVTVCDDVSGNFPDEIDVCAPR
jgi:hypothetical protein